MGGDWCKLFAVPGLTHASAFLPDFTAWRIHAVKRQFCLLRGWTDREERTHISWFDDWLGSKCEELDVS